MTQPEYVRRESGRDSVRIKQCPSCGFYCKICETKKKCCLLDQPTKKGEKDPGRFSSKVSKEDDRDP